MEKPDLQLLEARIDALIQTCKQFADENKALRENQASLMSERATLIEKNTIARTRIEAMIAQLKSMEVSA